MKYRCTACEHRWEIEDDAASRRPRCPSCMRVSGVEPDRSGERRVWPRPGRRAVLVMAIVVALGAAGVATWSWLAESETDPSSGLTSASWEGLDKSKLDDRSRRWHETVASKSDLGLASDKMLRGLDVQREPARARRAIASVLASQIHRDTLHVVEESAEGTRRPPLEPEILADGVLTAIAEGDGAYLYGNEISVLVSALSEHVGLEHDLVLLDDVEPSSARRPLVAVRFASPDPDEPSVALDPRTATLRPADALPGFGAELAWAEYALMHGRRALANGDVASAVDWANRAANLTPEPWPVAELQARIALEKGRVGTAADLVDGLPAAGDHPLAWLVEAEVHAAELDTHAARTQHLVERLGAIVEAFPGEARLAVALGDALRQQERFDAARSAYERALRRDPDVAGARTGLALLYAASDPSRAVGYLREELARHTRLEAAYLALADVHLMHGRPSDAARARDQGREVADDVSAFDAAYERLEDEHAAGD